MGAKNVTFCPDLPGVTFTKQFNIGVYNLRGEACAFNCGSNGVSIEGIEGSTPPGETENFAAVV